MTTKRRIYPLLMNIYYICFIVERFWYSLPFLMDIYIYMCLFEYLFAYVVDHLVWRWLFIPLLVIYIYIYILYTFVGYIYIHIHIIYIHIILYIIYIHIHIHIYMHDIYIYIYIYIYVYIFLHIFTKTCLSIFRAFRVFHYFLLIL